jgi:hypothetical protein
MQSTTWNDVEPGDAGSGGAPKMMKDPAVDLSLSRILTGFLELGAEQLHHVLVEPLLGLAET